MEYKQITEEIIGSKNFDRMNRMILIIQFHEFRGILWNTDRYQKKSLGVKI